MVDFDPLYVTGGVGPVHINRFRTRIRPNPGQRLPTGEQLIGLMPRLLDSRTAAVEIVPQRRWRQEASLQFRGVASVRPFILLGNLVPIPLPPETPEWIKRLGVPAEVRNWLIPDKHTDSVGRAYVGERSFTAQTLRRRYETGDDIWIRTMIEHVVIPMFLSQIPIVGPLIALTDLAARKLLGRALLKPLSDYAIAVNQHHFLAGRRSFLMMADGKDWVFETAALKRYSRMEFEHATDIVMGGAVETVSPVWLQMGAMVANHFGRAIAPTERLYSQQNPRDWDGDAVWRDVNSRHAALHPG